MIADDFFAYEFRTPDNLNTPQYLMRVTSAETFEEFIGLILTPEAAAELFDNFEPFFRSRNDLLPPEEIADRYEEFLLQSMMPIPLRTSMENAIIPRMTMGDR